MSKETEMIFLPGRRVVSRSPHRRVGYVSCPWFQEEQIAYESLLELGFVRIALLCPGVQKIQAQPFKLPLGDGLHYTPDFLLTINDSLRLVVEVKPREHVPKHQRKLDVAADVLRTHGYEFLLCTDESIVVGGRHDKAAKLLRHGQSMTCPEHCARIESVVQDLRFPQTLEHLAKLTGLEPHQVCGAIARRALALNANLGLEQIYSPGHLKDKDDDGYSPYTAWLGAHD